MISADQLVKLPDGIEDMQAAAMMMKGLTARYLVCQTYAVNTGTTMLVHAAAGGVGLMLCQWAKHLGATVIGTVSSEEKAALAKAHGCAYTINYTREDFAQRVHEIFCDAWKTDDQRQPDISVECSRASPPGS